MSARLTRPSLWLPALAFFYVLYAITYLILRLTSDENLAGGLNTFVQVALHVGIAILAFSLAGRFDDLNRHFLISVGVAGVAGMFSDGVYGYLVNVLGVKDVDSDPRGVWYITAFLVYLSAWTFAWALACWRLAQKRRIDSFLIAAALTIVAILAMLFLLCYLPLLRPIAGLPPWITMSHAIMSILESFALCFAVMSLVYAPRVHLVILIAGYSTLVATDFILRVKEMKQVLHRNDPCEALWTTGLCLVVAGLLYARRHYSRDGMVEAEGIELARRQRSVLTSAMVLIALGPLLAAYSTSFLVADERALAVETADNNSSYVIAAVLAIVVLTTGVVAFIAKQVELSFEHMLGSIEDAFHGGKVRDRPSGITGLFWSITRFDRAVSIVTRRITVDSDLADMTRSAGDSQTARAAKIFALEAALGLRSEKLKLLHEAFAIATDPVEKFRFERQIAEETKAIESIGSQLDALQTEANTPDGSEKRIVG